MTITHEKASEDTQFNRFRRWMLCCWWSDLTLFLGQQPQCAPGWYLYDGKCYSRILGNIVYKEAVEICDAFQQGTIISAPEHYGVFVSTFLLLIMGHTRLVLCDQVKNWQGICA